MSGSWHDSYLGRIRKLVGTPQIIVHAVQAIILDDISRC
jgi:hypothetical protein